MTTQVKGSKRRLGTSMTLAVVFLFGMGNLRSSVRSTSSSKFLPQTWPTSAIVATTNSTGSFNTSNAATQNFFPKVQKGASASNNIKNETTNNQPGETTQTRTVENGETNQKQTHLRNNSVPQQQHHDDAVPPESQHPNLTLALVDPRFPGGFRNQHMRFVALVYHAAHRGIPNLLLDSLRWDNSAFKHSKKVLPRVRHELLFDVDHWNRVAAHVNQQQQQQHPTNETNNKESWIILPRLVRYSPHEHPEWNPETGLFRNLTARVVLANGYNHRHHDLMKNASDCTQPYAYGSGHSVLGRLWTLFLQLQRSRGEKEHDPVEQAVYQAVQPSPLLQQAIDSILASSSSSANATGVSTPEASSNGLLVIHPRCELDIINHRKCKKLLVKNLTTIFQMIEESEYFTVKRNNNDTATSTTTTTTTSTIPRYERAFLCIDRHFMELKDGGWYESKKTLADENLATLNRATDHERGGGGLWNGCVPTMEGGQRNAAIMDAFPPEASGMAAQVLDFFVAVKAAAFVGTFGSSYSTDVWTVRYYLGKGDTNYHHSIEGVKKIGNGGLPPPHKC
jgi:hypothetical protein